MSGYRPSVRVAIFGDAFPSQPESQLRIFSLLIRIRTRWLLSLFQSTHAKSSTKQSSPTSTQTKNKHPVQQPYTISTTFHTVLSVRPEDTRTFRPTSPMATHFHASPQGSVSSDSVRSTKKPVNALHTFIHCGTMLKPLRCGLSSSFQAVSLQSLSLFTPF